MPELPGLLETDLISLGSQVQVVSLLILQIKKKPGKKHSTWVMMNEQTRRLSKMPEEVRAELSPRLIEKQAVKEDNPEKIVKLNSKATYVNSDLKVIH